MPNWTAVSAAAMASAQELDLGSWVRSNHVSWEARPLKASDHGTVRAVGYEVTLYAPVPDLAPGCAICLDAFSRLRAVAMQVLPDASDRLTVCRVRPFDGALHLRAGPRGVEPSVQLEVEVQHKTSYLADIDECEARCGREIQESLRRLGAVPAGTH
jgi:hypothetical protein